MRIRKRYQNPLPSPDLSSPLPASTPPVAATGRAAAGKEGEAMTAAAAAAAAAAATEYVSGGACGGGEGKGLHPNGRTTNPTTCLQPFLLPPSATIAAAAGAAERGDLPSPGPPFSATRDVLFHHGHGRQVLKREQDGENGWDIGDAHSHSGDNNPPAPKSLDAKASEAPVGHGGQRILASGAAAALAAAEAMVWWSNQDGDLSLKKRRGGYNAARGRSLGLEEEEQEKAVAEGEMKQPRPSKSRRRRTAVSSTPTMAAPAGGSVLTSAGTGNIGGAPTATGADPGDKYDDVMVKEEGVDVVPAAAAALVVDGNHGSGNGKKRRSPAVLMNGSRCSRVNGRGWRCCQQTLVGYSLCEHHLGKGRLRSVSSVRCNGRARKKENVYVAALPSAPSLLLPGEGEDEEEEKPGKRRRNKKIGMVKARSISSLLHQPDHPAPTTILSPAEPFPSPSPTPATRPVTAAAPPPYGADTAVA